MKRLFPFAVGSIVMTFVCVFFGLADSLTWYSIHEVARVPFLWVLVGVYAPTWVIVVDFLTRKREKSLNMKALLYALGALVYWGLVIVWASLEGVMPNGLPSELFYIFPIIIGISLICAFVFWALVTIMSTHWKVWGVIGIVAVLFNVVVAFVPFTTVEGFEIKDGNGVKEVSFSRLTGEVEIPFHSTGKGDYFILMRDVDADNGKIMYKYKSKNGNAIELVDGQDVYREKGPNAECNITIIAKAAKNSTIKIYHGTDVDQVLKDYHEDKGI